MDMVDGQRVEVQLSGEGEEWFPGIVIKARKQWVELDAGVHPFLLIADEGCITNWRPIP